MTNNKTIGIITGSGPAAGVDLWVKLLRRNEALGARGDQEAPAVVILSVPGLGASMELEQNVEQVEEELLAACEQISTQCDYFCIACTTLHYFSAKVRKAGLPAQFVSHVDVALEACTALELAQVMLLGSRHTMDLDGGWSSYIGGGGDAESGAPIRIKVPEGGAQLALHALVREVKLNGADACVAGWRDFLHPLLPLLSEVGTGLLLSCTELPLLADADARLLAAGTDPGDSGTPLPRYPVLDITDLLATKLASLARGNAASTEEGRSGC